VHDQDQVAQRSAAASKGRETKMANYWDHAPELQQQRLELLAGLLASVRREVLATHEPEKGDNNWVLGCRAYGRSCSAITEASRTYEWLGVLDESLHYVFTIGGVPVRFAHGDHEQPSAHLLRRDAKEAHAQQLAFDLPELLNWRWRIIVETDSETLQVTNVALIQATGDGAIEEWWPLLSESVVPAELRKEEAEEIPPPSVAARSRVSDRSVS
jgi:hypothetical protein